MTCIDPIPQTHKCILIYTPSYGKCRYNKKTCAYRPKQIPNYLHVDNRDHNTNPHLFLQQACWLAMRMIWQTACPLTDSVSTAHSFPVFRTWIWPASFHYNKQAQPVRRAGVSRTRAPTLQDRPSFFHFRLKRM